MFCIQIYDNEKKCYSCVPILNRVDRVVTEKVIFEWILEWQERMSPFKLGNRDYQQGGQPTHMFWCIIGD